MDNEVVKIIVSQAGIPEANGEFVESGKRDGVRRWESESGYEIFRFNVPGKGRSSGKRWFFGKISNKASYYIRSMSDVPPQDGWNRHPTGIPPVPHLEYVYKNDNASRNVGNSDAERIAAEKAEEERLAAEKKAEEERIAAEKAEAERLAAEKKAEEERLAAEKKAEEERLAAEKAEAERLAAEKKAEEERIAAEKAEAERIAAEKAEEERIAAEKAEAERLAAEKAEAERIAAEKKAEEERIAAEKAEEERLAAEKAEAERLAAEKAEEERLAAEKAEAERIAAEKAEEERLAAEKKAEEERLAAEKAEAEEERLAAEKAEELHRPAIEKGSALDRLLQSTPAIPINTTAEPPPLEEEVIISPSEQMLITGILSASIDRCTQSPETVYHTSIHREYVKKGETHVEDWETEIAYNRFKALSEYLSHSYSIPLPKLPPPPKRNANTSHLNASATTMNAYLQNVLTLRNGNLIDTQFNDGSTEPEQALTSDILQLVLRGYGLHNPLGQRQGGVRVKLELTETSFDSYMKEECRLALQNDCCADCGVRIGIKQGLFKKDYRYCEYSHYYYCLKCHSNQMMMIPCRLVNNFDFKQYPVANVCAEYLSSIYEQPVICISAVDPMIVEKNSTLRQVRQLRTVLSYMYDYIKVCKQKEELLHILEPRLYFMMGTEMLSIKDFEDMKNDKLIPWLKEVIARLNKHITQDCLLCKAKGFVCEICGKEPAIYPFQFETTTICRRCNSVYHKNCFKSMENCPKCKRIHDRHLKEQQDNGSISEGLIEEERHQPTMKTLKPSTV